MKGLVVQINKVKAESILNSTIDTEENNKDVLNSDKNGNDGTTEEQQPSPSPSLPATTTTDTVSEVCKLNSFILCINVD